MTLEELKENLRVAENNRGDFIIKRKRQVETKNEYQNKLNEVNQTISDIEDDISEINTEIANLKKEIAHEEKNEKCNTTDKLREWLDDNEIEYEEREISIRGGFGKLYTAFEIEEHPRYLALPSCVLWDNMGLNFVLYIA